MSRPDPKPAALELSDLLGYKLAHSEHARAVAELQAAERGVMLAKQQLAASSAYLEQTRVMVAKAYGLGDGDSFDRFSGKIQRAPIDPTEPPGADPAADQGDGEQLGDTEPPKGAKPNGAKETATHVP